jgi:hypothetical protein
MRTKSNSRRLVWSAVRKHRWWILGLSAVTGVVLVCIFALEPTNPEPILKTIQPGMTYHEVRAILSQPAVAVPLAQSFGGPVKEAQAVVDGQPSFERREWGRVDGSWEYEPESCRTWRTQNGVPLSTAERREYTVRQWGVCNTRSYSFIAVFDDKEVLVCRWVSVPSESWLHAWIRINLGL